MLELRPDNIACLDQNSLHMLAYQPFWKFRWMNEWNIIPRCVPHILLHYSYTISLSLSLSLFWSSHSIWYCVAWFILFGRNGHVRCLDRLFTIDKKHRFLGYKGSQNNFDNRMSLLVSNCSVKNIAYNYFLLHGYDRLSNISRYSAKAWVCRVRC